MLGNEIVKSEIDILNNLSYLESIRSNPLDRSYEGYKKLIGGGKAYLPYLTFNGIRFAPSRFIGYKSNNVEIHAKFQSARLAGNTTVRINKLINDVPQKNIYYEEKYINFCNELDIKYANNKRKYWKLFEYVPHEVVNNFLQGETILPVTTVYSIINSRRGQRKFRDNLLQFWNYKCCLTDCKIIELLRASHIKPWVDSDDTEKLSVFNGLLLSPNMDAIFELGLISFELNGTILKSKSIKESQLFALGCDITRKVNFKPQHEEFLVWHRTHKFKG